MLRICGFDFSNALFDGNELGDMVFYRCNFDFATFKNVSFRAGMFVKCS